MSYVEKFNELARMVKGITRVTALTDEEIVSIALKLHEIVTLMPPEMQERVIIELSTGKMVKYKDLPRRFAEDAEFRANFMMALRHYADTVL